MTTTPLPPLPVTEHNHPEHAWRWTPKEIRWMDARDAQWQAYATAARADFTDEWTGYLKDGETPFERFMRERKDLNALTKLYQRALDENERLKAQQPQAEAKKSNCTECRNSDSWGLPDKPVCNSCHAGSEWAPLNRSSVNPNKQPQAAAVHHKPVRVCHIKDVACAGAAVKCGECPDAAPQQAEAVPSSDLNPDEGDPVTLWAEIWRLREAVKGPDGYATWQDAATAERIRRVRAESKQAEASALIERMADALRSCSGVPHWPSFQPLINEASKWKAEAVPSDVVRDAAPIPGHELVTMYDERPTSDLGMIEFVREVERRHGIGVQPQHITDGSPCWCNPDVAYTDPETGASVIVHRRPQ